jgi:beta-mannosidase
MFIPCRIDVTSMLEKKNRLAVCLASPHLSPDLTSSFPTEGWPPKQRLFTRKAQSCYGWDIAPRLVTCGIWKPVSVTVTDTLEIRNVNIQTKSLDDGSAEIEILAEIQNHKSSPVSTMLTVTVDGSTVELPAECIDEFTGVAHFLTVQEPRLWWPHDHGNPELYDISIQLICSGNVMDEYTGRFGIRTVELIQEDQSEGKQSFFFKINNKPVFMKGMNWTPADAIYTRITRERYVKLLETAKDVHINALRVWGGGIYEHDVFYEFCDENGILVWQDFMFACGTYPQDEWFLNKAKEEAEYVIKRLRIHPSIFVWCGDNENDWLSDKYGVDDYISNPLSKKVLSSAVKEFSPYTPYVPSSPFSIQSDDQNSPDEGDVHLWAHGTSYKDDFYLKCFPRMVTEMGHIALPDMEVIKRFIPEDSTWPIFNDAWRMHSTDPRGTLEYRRLESLFKSIEAQRWEKPGTVKDLIEKTQKLQADATRTWIRHFSSIPECWGIFLWNLADCWPQVSDAYIAYPFNPKPAFEVVKEEYGKINRRV